MMKLGMPSLMRSWMIKLKLRTSRHALDLPLIITNAQFGKQVSLIDDLSYNTFQVNIQAMYQRYVQAMQQAHINEDRLSMVNAIVDYLYIRLAMKTNDNVEGLRHQLLFVMESSLNPHRFYLNRATVEISLQSIPVDVERLHTYVKVNHVKVR